MTMIRRALRALFICSLLTTFGCGGDGLGGTPEKTRLLQIGDSWVYYYEGPTPPSALPGTGTATYAVSQEYVNGESVLAQTVTMSFPDMTWPVGVVYLKQDPNTRDLLLYGWKSANGPLVSVTDRPLPVMWPGTWEAGKTVASSAHFSDGSSSSSSFTVIGQETVTTSAGTFKAWRCEVPGPEDQTVWFVPQLGNFVENRTRAGINAQSYVLQSTNIPVD